MVLSLQETGQSVDIELLPFLVVSYFKIVRQVLNDASRSNVRLDQADRVQLLCRARDDAEALLSAQKGEANAHKDERVWNGFTCS